MTWRPTGVDLTECRGSPAKGQLGGEPHRPIAPQPLRFLCNSKDSVSPLLLPSRSISLPHPLLFAIPISSGGSTPVASKETGNWSSTMASNVWHNWTSLRFLSGFMPYLEAGAGWFVQVKEALKVKMMGYNPMRKSSPHVTHKIKMASMPMSMDEVSKTYKITPIRR